MMEPGSYNSVKAVLESGLRGDLEKAARHAWWVEESGYSVFLVDGVSLLALVFSQNLAVLIWVRFGLTLISIVLFGLSHGDLFFKDKVTG